jgi:cell division septal protein FtsQ
LLYTSLDSMLFRRKSENTLPKEGKFVEHHVQLPEPQKIEKEKKKYSGSRKKITMIFLGIVAVLGWLYIGFFSEICSIQRIEIEGIKQLGRGEVVKKTQEAIAAERTWPFHEGNIFLLHKKELEITLKDHLFVQSVVVDKIYPNILRLKIEERKSSLILQTGEGMFEVDRNGMVTRSINAVSERAAILQALQDPKAAAAGSPVLTITQPLDLTLNNPIIDKNADVTMQEWLDAIQTLSQKDFGYRSAELENVASTKLILHLFEPYDVYFDLLNPLEPQIQSYVIFARSHSPSEIKAYVDARIPGRIFYQ